MSEFVLPAAYSVLVWWFTTGIILFLDGLPRATFRWTMTGATFVLIAAAYVLRMSAGEATVAAAYTAFTSAVLVWGWLEMSFLMGFITGTRKHACRERCSGWRHFLHATQAIIYNELAILLGAAVVTAATWHMPNRVALGTYLILWAMRLSAKLNLFLGVPNLGEQFLPPHLLYLRSFFKKRAMNLLFPVSVSVSTAVTVWLAEKFIGAQTGFASTSYALTTSLIGLAVVEHWFMVIPLPSERLWSWAFRSNSRAPNSNVGDPHARSQA